MQFLIADTFTDSLTKLNNHEQKAVKTTEFDLQVNPANQSSTTISFNISVNCEWK